MMKNIRATILILGAMLMLAMQARATMYFGRPYDPNLQRWIQRDPIGEAGGVNLFQFVGNNPINFIDPWGLATAVIIGGPTSSNPFGHASIATTGQGVYSFGTSTVPGSSLTDFLNKQATYRDSTVYILNTTPDQEKAINAYLQTVKGKPIKKYPDNCANRTASALAAAGIELTQTVAAAPSAAIPMEVPINPSFPDDIASALELNLGLDPLQISVTQGTVLPPKFLTGFNPK